MSSSEHEWKDWAWIKAQARKRPALWVSVAVWLVSGLVPLVPVYMSKGEGHVYYMGRLPLLLAYVSPLDDWPVVIAHVALSGILGWLSWRAIGRLARLGRRTGPLPRPSEESSGIGSPSLVGERNG
jgi:hypothetical protein